MDIKRYILFGGLALAGCDRVRDQAPAPVAVPTELACLVSDSATGRLELPTLGVAYTIRFEAGRHGLIVADAARPGGFVYEARVGFAGHDTVPFALLRQGVAAAERGRVLVRLQPNVCLPRAIRDSYQLRDSLPARFAVLANDTVCGPGTRLIGVQGLGLGRWEIDPQQPDKLLYRLAAGPPPRDEQDSAVYQIRGPRGFVSEAKVRVMTNRPPPPPPPTCAERFRPQNDTIYVRQGINAGAESIRFFLANDSACAEDRPTMERTFRPLPNFNRKFRSNLGPGTLSFNFDSTLVLPFRIDYSVCRGGQQGQQQQCGRASIFIVRRR